MQTTLNLDGAQLTGPTEELFRSWMREYAGWLEGVYEK